MKKAIKYFLIGVGAATAAAAAYILLKPSDDYVLDVSENDVEDTPKKQSHTAGFSPEEIKRRKERMQEKLSKKDTAVEADKEKLADISKEQSVSLNAEKAENEPAEKQEINIKSDIDALTAGEKSENEAAKGQQADIVSDESKIEKTVSEDNANE